MSNPPFRAAPLARLALALLVGPLALHAQDTAPAEAMPGSTASFEQGRAYSAMFYAGRFDSLWAKFSPQMKAAMKNDVATLRAFQAQVIGQLGAEKEVVTEEIKPSGEYALYVRTIRMVKAPAQRFVMQWAVTKDGTIGGFLVQPAPELAASPYLSYETKTPLQLPFEGDWSVVWGGRTLDRNYHAVNAEQRFALDLLVKQGGATHGGDGKALTDYYCFGKPIFAPGAGTIAKIVDGNPDNAIGTTDPRNAAGNHVVIDHGNGEYSILAHLKYASVQVKMGDVVKQGDPIGACGNSGNTSEPHLHYQLQDKAAMFADAKGLPAQFLDYVADGKPVPRGEPVRGQTIGRAKKP